MTDAEPRRTFLPSWLPFAMTVGPAVGAALVGLAVGASASEILLGAAIPACAGAWAFGVTTSTRSGKAVATFLALLACAAAILGVTYATSVGSGAPAESVRIGLAVVLLAFALAAVLGGVLNASRARKA